MSSPRDKLIWVLNDIRYKAPEQYYACMGNWTAKIFEAIGQITIMENDDKGLRNLCGRLAEALVEFSENDQYSEAEADLVDEGRIVAGEIHDTNK